MNDEIESGGVAGTIGSPTPDQMLNGKTIRSVEKDNYGRIVLSTEEGDVAEFGSDTVKGDRQMTCVTLYVNDVAVFPRPTALEPAGA